MRIDPDDRAWLEASNLVDEGVDLERVDLRVGGFWGRYLRWRKMGAITFRYHVHFRDEKGHFRDEERLGRRPLLVHELVHVSQYRQRGFLQFLGRYLSDWARNRFRSGRDLPLEAPAYARQAQAKARPGADD